jgi:hypothetical protein
MSRKERQDTTPQYAREGATVHVTPSARAAVRTREYTTTTTTTTTTPITTQNNNNTKKQQRRRRHRDSLHALAEVGMRRPELLRRLGIAGIVKFAQAADLVTSGLKQAHKLAALLARREGKCYRTPGHACVGRCAVSRTKTRACITSE